MLDVRRIDWVAVEDRILVAVMHDEAGHKICVLGVAATRKPTLKYGIWPLLIRLLLSQNKVLTPSAPLSFVLYKIEHDVIERILLDVNEWHSEINMCIN